MLAVCMAASALMPSPTPLLAPAAQRSAAVSMRLSLEEERIESVKAVGIAAVSGSLLAAPVKASVLLASSLKSGAPIAASAFTQWEFTTLMLAFELALFGAVYRCIVRSDDNDLLKQGAVGAFALVRALSATQFSSISDVWLQIITHFGEASLAFGGAAAALEYAFGKGYARRIPPEGLPNPETGYPEYHDDPLYYGDYYENSYREPRDRYSGYVTPTSRTYGSRDADERKSMRGGRYY